MGNDKHIKQTRSKMKKFYFIIFVIVCTGCSTLSKSKENGLSIRIGYSSSYIKDGKKIISLDLRNPKDRISVVLVNHTKDPINLWERWNSWGYFNLHFEVFDSTGEKLLHKIKLSDNMNFTMNIATTLTLFPGDAYVYEADWNIGKWGWDLPFYKGNNLYRFKMRAVYENTDSDGSWGGVLDVQTDSNVWTGKIASDVRTYEVSYYKANDNDRMDYYTYKAVIMSYKAITYFRNEKLDKASKQCLEIENFLKKNAYLVKDKTKLPDIRKKVFTS